MTDTDTFWQVAAELTLAVSDQHAFTWSMLWTRLPNKAHTSMARGDRILVHLRSDLEEKMFRDGGPQDLDIFYPRNREPGRRYVYTPRPGRKHPTLSLQEWREIAEELDKCTACMDALIKFTSGHVRAKTLDHMIAYQDAILRAKMALEPYARKHIGFWSVLYPRGGAP